ncbi:YqhA family protein [Deinococcus sp. KSM4-11]|uniref:YqhA family protein n=1 Tax=Deinococcus sp. KSM4-11 TaxID=2568654 RepID=UPI0010A4D182|nr:YqhA family protein [Deinococcus sp. KSM4-11]THF85175.1 YqhA family protein [Deinococcus sp. KSM4-11]
MARDPDPKTHLGRTRSVTLAGAFGFTRLIVELGVLSSFAFSLALFIAAIVQAYETIRQALGHLGDPHTTKTLIIAAVEQADTLLVGMALLIISFGLQALFVGRLQNVPAWLHIDSFDDLKQKLIGIVIVALAVNFFSVALEWKAGSDILVYGAAISAVIIAVGTYSVILSRQGTSRDGAHSDVPGDDARP